MHSSDFVDRLALITGASSGIGAATSLLLSQKRIHVILVARRLERLMDLKTEITNNNGLATVIQADLSSSDERIRLFQTLQAQNLSPDILVNNAGFAWYGYFHQMPWTIAEDIIDLNIAACTHLASLFLPGMIKNHFGRIINIGSIAGKLPEQGIAVYSASKAYLDAFTTSIYRELKYTGVTASILRPGPVKTEFFDTARALENGDSVPAERFAISADRVASAIWQLTLHPRRAKYVPFYLSISPLLEQVFSGIIDQLGPFLLKHRRTAH